MDILELCGISAFAVSGAIVGIKKRLDIFGVLVVALIAACGGGLIRDVILGRSVPVLFSTPSYLLTTIATTIVVCLMSSHLSNTKKYTHIVYFFDAVGLGVFSIISAYSAYTAGYPKVGVIFLGCITGIGGGMMRDVLIREIPVVLRREIYALACLIGIVLMIFLYPYLPKKILLPLCITIVVAVRMLSIFFNWNIPKVRGRDKNNAA